MVAIVAKKVNRLVTMSVEIVAHRSKIEILLLANKYSSNFYSILEMK